MNYSHPRVQDISLLDSRPITKCIRTLWNSPSSKQVSATEESPDSGSCACEAWCVVEGNASQGGRRGYVGLEQFAVHKTKD